MRAQREREADSTIEYVGAGTLMPPYPGGISRYGPSHHIPWRGIWIRHKIPAASGIGPLYTIAFPEPLPKLARGHIRVLGIRKRDPFRKRLRLEGARVIHRNWPGTGYQHKRFRPLLAHGPRSTRELSRSGPTHKRLVRECIMPAHHLPVRCGDTPITHILEGAMAQPIPIIKWFFGLFLRFY